ncbi:MAG TPA: phytanoyl-CoA dioxygenase family protein [Rhizomicrobium sp.]|jgi:ectoine hydroxylase-related dioxygenase (phytanoyl-CoA dioxygenase family)|nr:phytanoyl-CoA dioxygenase family protein [Rhizomicrobium sp.]
MIDLSTSQETPADAIASVRDNGHCVVRGLASAEEVVHFRPAIESAVLRHAQNQIPLEERGTYGKAFLQVTNIWQHDDLVKRFVFAPRFAKAAADLLGVPSVRLYHDQALCKEPHGGHTPWHQDQNFWPLDTDKTITMWMPLVDVPAEVGSMTFGNGTHTKGDICKLLIGDDSEEFFADYVNREQVVTKTHGAMKAGDATFHKGWTLHRAPANPTDLMRSVMTIIYYADGTRISAIDSKARRLDQKVWLNSIPTGDLAAGPLNPVLWPVAQS